MVALDVVTYLIIIGYCVSSITAGETIQITDSYFHYPWALGYINNAQYIIAIITIPIWKYYKSYFNLKTNIIKSTTQHNALYWFVYYSLLGGIITSIYQILMNISLQGNVITVPTSTAISSMEPVPVLILSMFYLKQKINLWMVFAMIISLIGILCFVFEKFKYHTDTNNEFEPETHDTYYGIILTISWTFLIAFKSVLTKQMFVYCFEKDRIIISAVLNRICVAIVIIVLFPWILFYPKQLEVNSVSIIGWKWVFINGCVAFTLHIFIVAIIALKSPLYLSIAATVQIPAAFIVDVFVHDYQFNIYAICGAILIIISFLMLEVIQPNHIKNICSCTYNRNINMKDIVDKNNPTDPVVHGLLVSDAHKNTNYGTISRL